MPKRTESDARFGQRVQELRQRRRWSAEELARKLGLSKAAIWNWEKRGRVPHPVTRQAVAELFEVQPSYFFDDDPDAATVPSVIIDASQVASSLSLEELIRAIEAKGFSVEIKLKN